MEPVASVPLEQRSTTRLALGFVGTIVLPIAVVAALIAYCIAQFANSLVDLVSHVPFF
jgi:hypothetical protein